MQPYRLIATSEYVAPGFKQEKKAQRCVLNCVLVIALSERHKCIDKRDLYNTCIVSQLSRNKYCLN